jgi:hypothetical protein
MNKEDFSFFVDERGQFMRRECSGDTGSSLRADSLTMHHAEQAFRRASPAFESTSILDTLRATEYTRLDELEHLYFDYTGGGLYQGL